MSGQGQEESAQKPDGHHHDDIDECRHQALVELGGRQDRLHLLEPDIVRRQARIRRVLVEGELEVLQERIEGEDAEDHQGWQQ